MRWIALVSLLVLAGCGEREEWTGWAYPNANDMTLSVGLSGFDTFEQCQQATIDRLRAFPNPDAAAYACGRGCKWHPELQLNMCAEIRK